MVDTVAQRDTAQVWSWLAHVPDPEIPVVSVVDMGMVRDVAWVGDVLEIIVTPTYSGCPATAVIAMDIEAALKARGVERLCITSQIAPPWTTDWMTQAAHDKLRAYGIAPPSPSGGPDACPQCGSSDVSRVSQFGSTPCKAQWRCGACLEPFDYFKCL
ncbi:1,2-phenylacetyl-CoA epoxidase subunit PaaD [Roseobacteraceae bacterium S113]